MNSELRKMGNLKWGIRNKEPRATGALGRETAPFLISHFSFRIFPQRSAFTLFEVMIALGVFAIAVTGLAIALETAVESALEARERSLARMQLESRLALSMADPPISGRRIIEARDNNGIRVEETLVPYEAKTKKGTIAPGLWKLNIVVDLGEKAGKGKETAEILLYRP